MIHSLIPTEHYLLVVDNSDIKEGDYYLRYKNSVLRCTELKESFNEALNKNETVILADGCGDPYERSKDYIKKIIAHLPLNDAAILQDIPLLSPIPTTADDILSIHEDENEYHLHSVDRKWVIEAMEQYKGNTQYTLEDMEYAFECGRNFQNNAEVTFKESLQHLHQQKMPKAFECDMGYKYNTDNDDFEKFPLSVVNQEGMEVWLGNYIY